MNNQIRNDALEQAARIAEAEVILDAIRGIIDVRPFGKEIAAEIRALKSFAEDQGS